MTEVKISQNYIFYLNEKHNLFVQRGELGKLQHSNKPTLREEVRKVFATCSWNGTLTEGIGTLDDISYIENWWIFILPEFNFQININCTSMEVFAGQNGYRTICRRTKLRRRCAGKRIFTGRIASKRRISQWIIFSQVTSHIILFSTATPKTRINFLIIDS